MHGGFGWISRVLLALELIYNRLALSLPGSAPWRLFSLSPGTEGIPLMTAAPPDFEEECDGLV